MWAARECTTSTATTCSVLLLHHRHSLRSRTHDWPLVHRPRHAQRLVHCIVEVAEKLAVNFESSDTSQVE